MPKENIPKLAIADNLRNAALEASEHGHFLESAIIIFQAIEFLLRMAIKHFGKSHGVRAANLRMAADREISFRRLVLHLDLIYPENGLSRRLLDLNHQRNTLMHRLYEEFTSIDALHDQIQALCKQGITTSRDLQQLVETKID